MGAEPTRFAIAVVFEDEGRERFVMARHAERGWEIPGGHVEDGEAPLEAAVREFAEETGRAILEPRIVLEQERSVGHCTVITGRLGPELEGGGPEHDDAIVDWRLVERITDVEPLAFPDDPYEEIEAALGTALR